MLKLVTAQDVLTEEEFNHYMTVLEVDFPKVYQAYLQNIKVWNIIESFLDQLDVKETIGEKK